MSIKIESKSGLSIILTLILVMLLVNNVRSIINYSKGLKRLSDARSEASRLAEENENLKKQEIYVQSDEYEEKAALENFNLTKDNSTILVMDKQKTFVEQNTAENAQTSETDVDKPDNLHLWLKSFNFY